MDEKTDWKREAFDLLTCLNDKHDEIEDLIVKLFRAIDQGDEAVYEEVAEFVRDS